MLSIFAPRAYKISSHYQASDFVGLIKLMEILPQTTPPLSHPFAAYCRLLWFFGWLVGCFGGFF